MNVARAVPALRARPGAHRRGDDEHRRGAGRARPPARRGHRRCPGTAHHALEVGLGRAARAARDDRLGHDHPGPPVPDRQEQHPGSGGGLRRVHRAGRLGGRRSSRGRARHRARHVPAADARTGRVGRREGARRCRSCSTSRTCSPMWPSSSGCSRAARAIAAASWLERTTYRGADAVTVLSDDLRRQRAGQAHPRAQRLRRRSGRGQGAGDPQLHRHRLDHTRARARTRTAPSSASPASGS